ncbi:unnamed protein product [Vitrella brassicaformis CCMP3155]|uniref:DNA-directed RNA polymerases I and III subunit RPAC2 n=1 Tax=Vitrella brassicaformis (strain CCMP3155) TaxID=1169540 RepID=A0A0G4GYG7_VITBC|nr:unnamed protein product [Vitrella brassicaformis CCMP3155]|eukprot:CEM36164.1 unnamed protein product [Vitrella brassicaformis CCMP3155]
MAQPRAEMDIPDDLGDDQTCATFQFVNEDHTLGNVVRYMLMKNPDIEFAGYSVPHPTENIMNLRVQTTERPASSVLAESLTNLMAVCLHVKRTYRKALRIHSKYQQQQQQQEGEGGGASAAAAAAAGGGSSS